MFSSSFEGRNQSLYPSIVRFEQRVAAEYNSEELKFGEQLAFIISIVFWAPVPIAVPSAPGILIPVQPHSVNPWSLGAAVNPWNPVESI